jgi:hypothetical protein
MAKNTTGLRSQSSSTKKYSNVTSAERLMVAMAIAVDNMIEEIKKPVDPEAGGSARKAELQSIKQTAIDCKELIIEHQKLSQMVTELKEIGSISEQKDYSGGFAEKFSK